MKSLAQIFRRPDDKPEFVSLSVGGRSLDFAIDPQSTDPIAHALAAGELPSDATSELWSHLLRAKLTVVDVGAHLGTYSLPAAALGACVLAVEASPTNASLLRAAAKRNALDNLEVLNAAATAQRGAVTFAAHGPWGHVVGGGDAEPAGPGQVEVEAVALDEVLRTRGTRVDVVKVDVEGFELDALAGMRATLDRDDAPLVLIESNGHMLHEYGRTPAELIATLERHGYHCHRIDPGASRRLVPVSSGDLQPECVADYFAFKATPEGLPPWWVDQPFTREELARRIAATCNDSVAAHRQYGARLLQSAPTWLLQSETIRNLDLS